MDHIEQEAYDTLPKPPKGAKFQLLRVSRVSRGLGPKELVAMIGVPNDVAELTEVPGLVAYLEAIKEPAKAVGIKGLGFPLPKRAS